MTVAEHVVIDRLCANLRTAGLAVDDTTIQQIVDKGFLAMPMQFDALAPQFPLDLVPDYLADGNDQPHPSPPQTGEGAVGWAEEDSSSTSSQFLPQPGEGRRGLVLTADSISATAQRLRQGEVSPVTLTEQALAQIAQGDPELNAFQLLLADRALAAAHQAERELRQGTDRGPLHGIPVAIKDLLDLAGTVTTAGSRILADNQRTTSATVVKRLEAAGAIIVGKTRMSEFAYAPSSINPHYGPTRNPRALTHDTGGSSSGSAAAVAAGWVYAALGSDTGGSIRIPAANCGLVGLKPTFGRISLAGAVNLSWSLDHLGPLTRTVADAALLFTVLAGVDPADARTRAHPMPTAAQLLGDGKVRGLRIGVLTADGSGNPLAAPEVLTAWRAGLQQFAVLGADLVEIAVSDMQAMRVVGATIQAHEALAYHQPNLRTRLADYGKFMRQRILAAYAYDSGAFVRAQQMRSILRQRAAALWGQVDLLGTPTLPAPAPLLGGLSAVTFTLPFNLLGWPAISVPVGQNGAGLPIGLQLAGKPWDEATVLRAAYALEAAQGDE